ncbi:MAG: hypothetical protein Q9210_001950 [Variospora velana]
MYPSTNTRISYATNYPRPQPSAQTRDVEHYAANCILHVSASDASLYQTYGNPTPLGYNNAERYHCALSYVLKVKGRLHPGLYQRFVTALARHGKGREDTLERTKAEVAVVFRAASECELYGEFVDAFMPHWCHQKRLKEEREQRLAEEEEEEEQRRRDVVSGPKSSNPRFFYPRQ